LADLRQVAELLFEEGIDRTCQKEHEYQCEAVEQIPNLHKENTGDPPIPCIVAPTWYVHSVLFERVHALIVQTELWSA
jgi:hypothetical protein